MQKAKILAVDDDRAMLELLQEFLSEAGYEVLMAESGEEAIKKAREENPDIILLDIVMPGMDGLEVKEYLGKNFSTSRIPVIFLTARQETEDKIKGFDAGAYDYITKPVALKELLARIKSILQRSKFYEKLSMTDGLTGLYNRHFFNEEFHYFFNLAKRYKMLFSLAIIDIDNLKKINDEHGHAMGDWVLQQYATVTKKTLRKTDVIMRYGGDEFSIIFPSTGKKQAIEAMKRVCEKIEGKKIKCRETGLELSFSISFGIATFEEDYENEILMLEKADALMYVNKQKKKEGKP